MYITVKNKPAIPKNREKKRCHTYFCLKAGNLSNIFLFGLMTIFCLLHFVKKNLCLLLRFWKYFNNNFKVEI